MEADNNVEYIEIQQGAIGLAPIGGGQGQQEHDEEEGGGAVGGKEQPTNLEHEVEVHMDEACDDEDDLMLDVGIEEGDGGVVGGEEQPRNLEHEAEVHMDGACDEEDDLMLDVGMEDEHFVMDEESDDELLPLIQ